MLSTTFKLNSNGLVLEVLFTVGTVSDLTAEDVLRMKYLPNEGEVLSMKTALKLANVEYPDVSSRWATEEISRLSEVSLRDIAEFDIELSEDQKNSLAGLFTSRCQPKTISRVHSMINYNLNDVVERISSHRFRMRNNHWEYCAGQSYPHEIAEARKAIIK